MAQVQVLAGWLCERRTQSESSDCCSRGEPKRLIVERSPVAKQPKGELVPVVVGFNYDLLEAKVAEKVRTSADRIRERVKKTVEDIIEVGNELLAVKDALEHGHFGPWLKAGWSERSAQNFMSVAERFKSAKFAEL